MHISEQSEAALVAEIDSLLQQSKPEPTGRATPDADPSRLLDALARASQHIQQTALLYSADTDNVSDLVLIVAPAGESRYRFLRVNGAFLRYAGASRDAVIGSYLPDVFTREDAAHFCEHCDIAARTRSAVEYDDRIEFAGKSYEVRISLSPRFDSHGSLSHIDGVCRDVTQPRHAERMLRKQSRRLHNILESISEAFITLDRDWHITYLNRRAEQIARKSRADLTGKVLWQEFPELAAMDVHDYLQSAWLRQTFVVFEVNLPAADCWFSVRVFPSQEGMAVYIQEVSGQKRAEHELKCGLERIRKSLDGIVNAMAIAVEMRDPYTAGHQRRVSALSCAIARQMHFGSSQVETLRIAGLLHDVGKISIPSEILNRPGPLSEAEQAIVRTHAQIGYDILKGIEFASPVAVVALQHHERLDGSGYPQGLAGDAIIPEAKILAVADVVEAMASHRPYRPALGVEQALHEILSFQGVRYDETVVSACLSVFSETGFDFEHVIHVEGARRNLELEAG